MKKLNMPHILLKDDNAVDLYFEFLDKPDREEVFNDLIRNKQINLPNFGRFKNVVKRFDERDIEPKSQENMIKKVIDLKTTSPLLEYENQTYHLKAANFSNEIYKLNDIPKKRKYIFERIRSIYPNVTDDEINKILDKITIRFRVQPERGASNHKTCEVFISSNEINKFHIRDKASFLQFLLGPRSSLVHEISHIFQNIFEVFPHVQYMREDGVDYDKYVTDKGEIQSRIEQILELANWGFEKNEIIQMLYNRSRNDKDMWNDLVDTAIKIKQQREEVKT